MLMDLNHPENPSVDYIKRVVGLPGDTIEYRNKHLTINGVNQLQTPDGDYNYVESGLNFVHTERRIEALGKRKHELLVNPDMPNVHLGSVAEFKGRENCAYDARQDARADARDRARAPRAPRPPARDARERRNGRAGASEVPRARTTRWRAPSGSNRKAGSRARASSRHLRRHVRRCLSRDEAAIAARMYGARVESCATSAWRACTGCSSHTDELQRADALVVVAGMEGALPSRRRRPRRPAGDRGADVGRLRRGVRRPRRSARDAQHVRPGRRRRQHRQRLRSRLHGGLINAAVPTDPEGNDDANRTGLAGARKRSRDVRPAVGAEGTAGANSFNTAMTGYHEILTDPSYAGQIVIMTYPLIGNYGVAEEDAECRRVGRGLHRARDGRGAEQLPLDLEPVRLARGAERRRDRRRRHAAADADDAHRRFAALRGVDRDLGSEEARRARQGGPADRRPQHGRERDLRGAVPLATRRSTRRTPPGSRASTASTARAASPTTSAPSATSCAAWCTTGFDVTVVPAGTPADDVLGMDPDGVFLSQRSGRSGRRRHDDRRGPRADRREADLRHLPRPPDPRRSCSARRPTR